MLTFTLSNRRVLNRSQVLQINHFYIPPSSFLSRRTYLIDALGAGKYLSEPVGSEGSKPKSPFTDPGGMDGMMDQMKKSMVMMVPQTVIMGWINFFFSGFVLSEFWRRSLEREPTPDIILDPRSQAPLPAHTPIQANAAAWD